MKLWVKDDFLIIARLIGVYAKIIEYESYS